MAIITELTNVDLIEVRIVLREADFSFAYTLRAYRDGALIVSRTIPLSGNAALHDFTTTMMGMRYQLFAVLDRDRNILGFNMKPKEGR